MPSPFPGMDPYLESRSWTTFHFSLAAEIVGQLAPKLRPRYVALPMERFVMEIVEGDRTSIAVTYSDVAIAPQRTPSGANGGVATATAPLVMETVVPERVPHVSIEIRDADERQLVTAIEILSPTNKRGEGYRDYLLKRGRLLNSSSHLLEIDLLRAGQRVPMREPLPPTPYFVFLSRAQERPTTAVWPIALNQPLPNIDVPLLPGDADVGLELQAAFNEAYDLLGYDLLIDYAEMPATALSAGERAFVGDLLDGS